MAYEQILTILLGAGVGVAVVLYAVRSRLFGASQSIVSGGSSIETFTVPSHPTSVSRNEVAPTLAATATQSPFEEFHVLSFGPVPPSSAEVASAGSSAAAVGSIDVSAAPSPASPSVTVKSRDAPARAQRAPRKSAGSPRTTRSRAGSQSIPTTRKALDEAAP